MKRHNLELEVGKTYLTRRGDQIRILRDTRRSGCWRFQGEDEQGRITWRSRKGWFTRIASDLDLVSEAPAHG